MKTDLKALLSNVDEAEKSMRDSVKEVIKNVEESLKSEVSFISKQEYDDNNYFTSVTIGAIDGIYFEKYDLEDCDPVTLAEKLAELKTHPKYKIKGLLLLKDEESSSDTEQEVLKFCINKDISVDTFFAAFDALERIAYLPLPHEKVENE